MNENGGYAFPVPVETATHNGENADGMKLRDYFAAKAMQGIIASGAFRDLGALGDESGWDGKEHPHHFLRRVRAPIVAEDSYSMADAMLKARGQ